jgi:hypothetical protein
VTFAVQASHGPSSSDAAPTAATAFVARRRGGEARRSAAINTKGTANTNTARTRVSPAASALVTAHHAGARDSHARVKAYAPASTSKAAVTSLMISGT